MARLVAFKALSAEAAADAAQLARFHETAKFAAQIHHPNIASIYDVSSADTLHFTTQEYVEGRPLGELLRARQKITAADAIRVAIDVAEAHRFANAKGMPGFQLCADRIMLSKRGEVKILPPTLTAAGAPVLDDTYLLPALGVLLYAMLTGGRAANLEAALGPGSDAVTQLPPIRSVARGTRPDIAASVDRLMGRTESPYGSVEAAIADLRRLLEAQEKIETRARSATERAQQRQKRTLLTIAIGGGAAALAFLIILVLLLSRKSATQTADRGFEQANADARGQLEQYKQAYTQFSQSPTPALGEAALAWLERAKATFRQFRDTYPDHPKTQDAINGIAEIDGEIAKCRDRVRQKMRLAAAQRKIKEVDDAFDADALDKAKRGGKIDVDRWKARYAALANEFPDVRGMPETVRSLIAAVPRRAERAQVNIEAYQLEHEFNEKLLREDQYGKSLEAWKAYLAKWDGDEALRKDALKNYDEYTGKIRRQAMARFGTLRMWAQGAAEKKDYARAREIYNKIIANFGISEWVEKAKEELAKLPKS